MSDDTGETDLAGRKARVNAAVDGANPKTEALMKNAFDVFEVVDMDRRELKEATYNPRQLDEKAKRKLRTGIKKLGMLGPACIWNKRTGRLVGGHQRIGQLDALNGTAAYTLKVAVVDLDEKAEREANILLNNREAQGDWDIGKLGEMFRETPLDLDATGFDAADIYKMFGDSPFQNREDNALDDLTDRLKASRQRYFDLLKVSGKRDGDHFYTVVVFKDTEDRDAWATALGLDENRFQDGRTLRRIFEAQAFQIAEQADLVARKRLETMPVTLLAERLAERLEATGRGSEAIVEQLRALFAKR
jgi:hypothetical protein